MLPISFPSRATRFSLIFLGLSALLASQQSALAKNMALQKLLKDDWQWELQHNPNLATEIGDMRYNHRLTDVSPAAYKASIAHAKQALQKIKQIPVAKLQGQELLSYAVFIDEKQALLRKAELYPYQIYPLSPQTGIHVELMPLVGKMPFRNAHDYATYIQRLHAVPQHIDGLIAQMQAGMQMGWLAPKAIAAKLPEQIRLISTQLEQSSLAEVGQQMPASIPLTQQKKLRQQIQQSLQEKVRPALNKLALFVEQKYLPACRDSIGASELPGGRAFYDVLVREATTTDMKAEEIHALGLKEVARIQARMQAVMKQTGFTGDFKQFVHQLNTEPQHFYTQPADLLQGYREIMQRAHLQLPKLFGHLPKGKVDVKAVPELGAESREGAYYEGGTLDGSRPGYFVANTSKLETRPKWKMESLTMHEAEPGHHLQSTIAQELKDLPDFRRFGWYNAYGEGWALYAELLGEEMGFYTDPYAMFGHLDDELFRAARLVVDTGIHALGWSRQQAIDYLNNNTANPPDDNVVEIDRYISWPAQALGYKIGELKILQLRAQAQAALGAQFDIREFHDVLLGNGGMPLNLLEQQVLAWQQAKLSSAKNKK